MVGRRLRYGLRSTKRRLESLPETTYHQPLPRDYLRFNNQRDIPIAIVVFWSCLTRSHFGIATPGDRSKRQFESWQWTKLALSQTSYSAWKSMVGQSANTLAMANPLLWSREATPIGSVP